MDDTTQPMRMKATKAHWAGGITTAVVMLAAYAFGVIDLDQATLMEHLATLGASLGMGATTWLGTYRAPANKLKPRTP